MFPLNLPNALTLIRILLVPVLVVALTVESPGGSTIAAIVFAIAALTDGLDGYIARSRQAVTTFGKVKTIVQVAAVLALIAASDPDAIWVQALVYTMVLVTVVSGADYFLNFRRKLEEASRARERTGDTSPA